MKRVSLIVGVSLILIYLTGVLWVPAEWGGEYLYMSAHNREMWRGHRAGKAEAHRSCVQLPETLQQDFDRCYDAAYSRGEAAYFANRSPASK